MTSEQDRRLFRMFAVLFRPATPGMLVILWRWRWELGVLLVGVGFPALLIRSFGATQAVFVLVTVVAVVLVLPGSGHALGARAWCVITPHRIRVACTESMIYTTRGKIPIVLLTRRRPYGELVYVWCRAGTHPADLVQVRDRFAAACWAREVHVDQWPDHQHVAVLHVVRREGLRLVKPASLMTFTPEPDREDHR